MSFPSMPDVHGVKVIQHGGGRNLEFSLIDISGRVYSTKSKFLRANWPFPGTQMLMAVAILEISICTVACMSVMVRALNHDDKLKHIL